MLIFISRDLNSDSIFRQMLENKAKLIGLSLLEFETIVFDGLPPTDWLFFYSKNGIKHCLSQLSSLDNLPAIGVIGKASADFLKLHYNINAQFVGNGKPKDTARQFQDLAQGQKVVFVQAKNSQQSIQKLLKGDIEIENLLVYDNCIKTDFELAELDVLVFTSPLNVQAYFAKYAYIEGQKIISIGQTTAKALAQEGIKEVIISAQTSELSLAKSCLLLIHQKE